MTDPGLILRVRVENIRSNSQTLSLVLSERMTQQKERKSKDSGIGLGFSLGGGGYRRSHGISSRSGRTPPEKECTFALCPWPPD